MVDGMKLLAAGTRPVDRDPLIGLREIEAAKKKAEDRASFALEALQSATIVSAAMTRTNIAERWRGRRVERGVLLPHQPRTARRADVMPHLVIIVRAINALCIVRREPSRSSSRPTLSRTAVVPCPSSSTPSWPLASSTACLCTSPPASTRTRRSSSGAASTFTPLHYPSPPTLYTLTHVQGTVRSIRD